MQVVVLSTAGPALALLVILSRSGGWVRGRVPSAFFADRPRTDFWGWLNSCMQRMSDVIR
eukprot:1377859-Pyramimonas_sp.AAC.1